MLSHSLVGWGWLLRTLPRTTDASYFMFNLGLAVAGLGAVLLGASDVQVPSLSLGLAFVAAFALVDAMSIRLSGGDTVFVDGAIALAAVILLPPSSAVVCSLLGVVLGAVFDTRNRKPLVVRLGEILRRPLLVAGLALLAGLVLDRDALAAGSALSLAVAMGLGFLYSAADFSLLIVGVSLERRIRLAGTAAGMGRSLVALYAAHMSLGVAIALLYPRGRLLGFAIMVALALLIQYSFNLLLRTKAAYGETIQALVRASELQAGEDEQGHSQRVADMAVHAGRILGLPSKALERLNYGALLHELGRIGMEEGTQLAVVLADHPDRGADIVGGIPFLSSAQAMIRFQSSEPSDSDAALSVEDATCARLIGVCCGLDRLVMNHPAGWRSWASVEEHSNVFSPEAEPRVRQAVWKAAQQVARTTYIRS